MRQVTSIIKRMFHDYCKEMIVAHPMLESALVQILEIEKDNTRKERIRFSEETGRSR